jgi:hypothetical protein
MASYIFSQISNYVRVTHYDDTVAHVPAAIFGYKHAGNEVWFKNERYDGQYIECQNESYLGENGQCSNSLWLKTGVDAHMTYLGVPISNSCYRKQPSGTLAAVENDEYVAYPPIE